MYFLPAICFVLGVGFFVMGRKHHEQRMTAFAICLFLASFGTGLILFLVANTLD